MTKMAEERLRVCLAWRWWNWVWGPEEGGLTGA